MRLRGARVGGDLYCNRAQLHNETGPALHAARLEVDGSVHLEELHATGHGDDGAVRLRDAHIGSRLFCNGAQLHNETGSALHAARLRVDGSVHLEELHATGHGDDGAVRLFGARIGNLFCSGAQLHNDAGPALNAEGLQVGGTVWLHDGFRATGHGEDGAVQNLIGVAPEEDRDVVAEVVRSVFGRQFTPLALGRQV